MSKNLPHLDDRLPLTLAADYVPSVVHPGEFEKRHYMVVYRWVTKGARGKKLKSVRDPSGRRYTTIRWMLEFFAAYEDVDIAPPTAPTKRAAKADAELDRLLD